MNWRDFAKKLRKVPKDILKTEVPVADDASDSELVRAVVDYLPQLKTSLEIDEADLDRDVSLWQDLRKKRSAQAPLDAAAGSADLKFKLVSELGSYPANEILRRTGKIGADETVADVASDAAGGGTKGAAAGAVALALVDPTNLITPAKAGASKLTKMALTGLGATGMSVQAVQVLKVGQEFGFDSPEFKAALAGSAAGVGTAHAMGYRPSGKTPGAAPPAAAQARVPERPLVVSGPLQGVPMPDPAPAFKPVQSRAGAMAPVALRPKDLVALREAEAYSKMRASKLLENARAEQKGVGVFEGLPDPLPRETSPEVVRAQIEAAIKAGKAPRGRKSKAAVAPPVEAPAPKKSIEQVRAEVDDLLMQDLRGVELEKPIPEAVPPRKPSINDIPRKYDPGLEADDVDSLDNGIVALEADIEASKAARAKKHLFEQLKAGKRKVMDPMTKKDRLMPVDGAIHIADWLDMKPGAKLTAKSGKKALEEIPEEYRSMFRYTGERDIGFHGIIEKLNQEGFFGNDAEGGGGLDGGRTDLPAIFRETIDRVLAGEKVFAKVDNDEAGNVAGVAAQDRITDILKYTGAKNKKALMQALSKRDGNPIELAFNEYVLRNDPWEIGAQKWNKEQQAGFEAADERAALSDADLPPGGFDPDEWGHASVKKRPGAARAPKAQPVAGMIPGVTPMQVQALNKNIIADPTISTWDRPTGASPEVMELQAAMQKHGPNSPEVKALIASHAAAKAARGAAPPGQPPKGQPPAAAASAPKGGGWTPLSKLGEGPPEIFLENPETGQEGPVRAVFDKIRGWARTEKSAVIRSGLMNVAETMQTIADRTEASMKVADKVGSAISALGAKGPDIAALADYIESGRQTLPADPAQAAIVKALDAKIGPELDRALEISTKLDPMNTAPHVDGYFPRTAALIEAEPPSFSPAQLTKPLIEEGGTYRAPSLSKSRNSDLSVPISDPEKLTQVLRSRARHAGLLEGGASKPRDAESYPLTWGKLLDAEVRGMRLKKGESPSPKQMEKATERARQKLEGIQLPDLFEAAVKDMPSKTWEEINASKPLVEAANSIIRGRDAMAPWARKVANFGTSIASFAQLGAAHWLNLLGAMHIAPLAMDAAKAQGKGPVGQAVAGTGAMLKTLGLTAKSTAEDISAAMKRISGDRLATSPAREEFGATGQTWNLPRRAVIAADRNVRKAFADVLEKLVPHLSPDNFKLIDRNLPLTDPKNLEIIRREMSGVSQGSGTAFDRVKPMGGRDDLPAQLSNIFRELSLQYSGPTLRQVERALPMMLQSPLKTAVGLGIGAQVAGELAASGRALQAGTGLNVPGTTEETEDQKNAFKSVEGFAKAVLSKDRSPNPAMRALQNFVIAAPGGREVFMAAAYGDSPLEMSLSGTPAGGFAKTAMKAAKVGIETGDWRTVLSLANMPGLGPEWLKIVLLEHAQEKSKEGGNKKWRDVGIGQMPENLGIPGKIWLVSKGEITAEEALRDMVGGEPLKFEEKVRKHHAKATEAKEKKKAKNK